MFNSIFLLHGFGVNSTNVSNENNATMLFQNYGKEGDAIAEPNVCRLLFDIRAIRFRIFFANLWKYQLKIPRDARVNAFAVPAIKSNENR